MVVVIGDGSGHGDGYGYGYGHGDGHGDGYGHGNGYGYGYGNGYGDGNGDGDGYGHGDGYGDGAGYGDGSGDGNGYGYGNGNDWIAYLAALELEPLPLPPRTVLAFWRCAAGGVPANGGRSGHHAPAAPGVSWRTDDPPVLCSTALHATTNPDQWKGDELWLVAMHEPILTDGSDKIGSAERTFIRKLL